MLTLPGMPAPVPVPADLERVYTPDALAHRCCGLLPWGKGNMRVLEPHAGGGAFLRALDGYTSRIHALDIDPTCWSVRERNAGVADFLGTKMIRADYDRVVGNPPFDNAEQHVDRALSIAHEVAFLLPVSRWDAAERLQWWQDAPLRHVWLFAERVWPGSRQIGFFWFDRSFRGRAPTIEFTSWRT
jgi:predicted RNA methylase